MAAADGFTHRAVSDRSAQGPAAPRARVERNVPNARWVAWLLLAVSCCAYADFNAGVMAYGHGDFATAYREWLPLARAGDSAAQFSLAVMYSEGRGVEADDIEAGKWYLLAAEQGLAAAQFTLGVLYAQGVGLPRDSAESAKWYARAAQQGDADAQFALGLIYSQGVGVPQDNARATEWFRQAAIQGLAVAQASLGLLYQIGHGVAQNDVCAYAWFNLAAANGSARAREKRDALRKNMTPEQVARGQALGDALSRTGTCAQSAAVSAASSDLVERVKTALRALGYDLGPEPIGEVSAQLTKSAVEAFQRDLGLTPNGQISEELLMLMRARIK